jgi:hypothetical protein
MWLYVKGGSKIVFKYCRVKLLQRSLRDHLCAVNSQPKLTQVFRLEVKFLEDLVEFKICLDPVLWLLLEEVMNIWIDQMMSILKEQL